MRRTVQDRGERHVCQGPKEPMRRQALAGEFGGRQAAEEAGESPGVGERLGLLAAEVGGLVPDSVVQRDWRTGWEAKWTAVGEAPGAMAAGRGAHLAEMGAEPGHLTAIVRCQL